VFVSRISRTKNLKFALEVLKHVNSRVIFDIYGPKEDLEYWKECKDIITSLPNNIQVTYKGSLDNNEVIKIIAEYDFFFFPTRGENYGHVIRESLSVGTPVIISDQTPWKDLEKENVGFVIEDFNHKEYSELINKLSHYNNVELIKMSLSARKYIHMVLNDPETIRENINVFK
jgi:glycosyltransferase involved in cell wall biosynthesis